MILQSLTRLAEREGLVDNPHYEAKEVHWAIELDHNGRFLGLTTLLTIPERTGRLRPRPRGPSILVPRPLPGSARTGTAPDPGFLVDNASFVLGLDLTNEQKIVGRQGETERRTRAFRELIEEASSETNDDALRAVMSFLISTDQTAACDAVTEKREGKEFEPNHLLVFRVGGDATFAHLRADVMAYWAGVRARTANTAATRQCLITGGLSAPIDKHPLIKKVPGGTPSGVAIVTFNASAFESYGFERNDNAPVSRSAAEAYTTALNRLLDPTYPDPRNPIVRLPEQRVLLSDDTVAVFWTETPSPVPAAMAPALGQGDLDALRELGIDEESLANWSTTTPSPRTTSPAPVRSIYESPWGGITPAELEDASPFRLLILSGGQGRATVRAFHTSQVRETVESVRQWFTDIRVSSLRGRPALLRLLSSLAVRGDRANLPTNLAGDVFLAIVADRPLPEWVLEATVRRCRSEANVREMGGVERRNQKVTPERAALVKAWLNRALRDPGQYPKLRYKGIEFQEVKPTMNESERNRGYLLGRMFACVERMQELALGEVGASVTDKYFASACATPQAVFPRLLKSEVHHFAKAREGKWAGTARWVHAQIGALAMWLIGKENGLGEDERMETLLHRMAGRPVQGFPAFLPLPEQGLFTLGYHQQRAEFFTKRGAVTDEPVEPSAPATLLPE